MARRIALVVIVLLATGLGLDPGRVGAAPGSGPAGSGTGSPPAATAVRSVTVPLDCGGYVEEVTVSARLPRRVGAGQAFTIADVTTSQRAGAVHLALSSAAPEELSFAGEHQPSTFQAVAAGRPGGRIELRVVGATRFITHDSWPPQIFPVACTPVGEARLGTIRIDGLVRPRSATGVVSGVIPLHCQDGSGTDLALSWVRVAFTAPARLRPADTFTLPDMTVSPILGTSLAPLARIPARGTDQADGGVTPTTRATVTAAPGQTVDLYVADATALVDDLPAVICRPVGPSHLASIPVARPRPPG